MGEFELDGNYLHMILLLLYETIKSHSVRTTRFCYNNLYVVTQISITGFIEAVYHVDRKRAGSVRR